MKTQFGLIAATTLLIAVAAGTVVSSAQTLTPTPVAAPGAAADDMSRPGHPHRGQHGKGWESAFLTGLTRSTPTRTAPSTRPN